ncbi:putative matrix protein 2 [Rainbow trout orthomyxovirus-1]|uniref:Matrix protein 2 n=1 Tax=Rainbow trout orthomyxovirus-1 TaxID=1954184 RepID=A0A1Q1MME0_9ORTO|nr:putative matrix protein 2 [Rainbow trout orthomyxovirus-1]AQM37682.1 putative matrix protein 2 [Rainbow trout orthomyxovirus-1]
MHRQNLQMSGESAEKQREIKGCGGIGGGSRLPGDGGQGAEEVHPRTQKAQESNNKHISVVARWFGRRIGSGSAIQLVTQRAVRCPENPDEASTTEGNNINGERGHESDGLHREESARHPDLPGGNPVKAVRIFAPRSNGMEGYVASRSSSNFSRDAKPTDQETGEGPFTIRVCEGGESESTPVHVEDLHKLATGENVLKNPGKKKEKTKGEKLKKPPRRDKYGQRMIGPFSLPWH